MAFGDNDQLEDVAENDGSTGSGQGRGLGYDSGSPKASIDDDIEKNLLIRTMPRKFKVSTPSPERTKGKAVGAVIMVVGLLVMGAAVYLVYAFLINPKSATPAPVVNKPVVNKPAVKTEETKPITNTEVKPATSTPSSGLNQTGGQISSTTTPNIISSSTTPVSPVATSTAVTTSTAPVVSGPISDLDGDGLSDAEESSLGTNPAVVDSDGDGYSDKAELVGLYNPAGTGQLSNNPSIAQYKDSVKKYIVFYPTRWRTQSVGDSMIFSAADNSFVQVVSEPNSEKKSILSWYNEQFVDAPAVLSDVVVKNGWEGLYLPDKQVFYLTNLAKTNIYTFSYTPSKEGDMTYYNIFQMMINSFSLTSVK